MSPHFDHPDSILERPKTSVNCSLQERGKGSKRQRYFVYTICCLETAARKPEDMTSYGT